MFFLHKKSFLDLGGYDVDKLFSGYTAVAKDFYIRALNKGFYVSWYEKDVVFHPWHPGSNSWYIYYFSDQKIILNNRIINRTITPNISYDGKIKENLDQLPDGFKNKLRSFILDILTKWKKR